MNSSRLNSRSLLGRLLQQVGIETRGASDEVLSGLAMPGLETRTVRVFLPPGDITPETPVLVALDGQMLKGWQLVETIGALIKAHAIVPPLVVAIAATRDRIEEYGTAGVLDYAGRGKKALAFQDFVIGTVLPAVRARYGLVSCAARTGVFGASMGGLCAFDLAWRYPEIFGFAGVFSGSLWWRAANANPAVQQSSRIAHQLVRATTLKPAVRLWFQAGTKDETSDRDGNGVIDAIQDTTELIDELVARGFGSGHDVAYHEVAGGEHHERTWAQALPVFLGWALAR